MALKEWKQLPFRTRRSKKQLYNYIKTEVDKLFDPHTVTLTVKDDNGDALSGATVVIKGNTETSNAQGKVEYDLINDTYSVTVSKDGYKTTTASITVDDTHTSFNVTILKLDTISFTVNDGTDPIEGASVVINETTKTTGAAGGCTFPDMLYDTYSVTVSKTGYVDKTEEIEFDSSHKSFTISLTAETPAEEPNENEETG